MELSSFKVFNQAFYSENIKNIHITGLKGSSKAYIIAKTLIKNDSRPIIFITSDNETASTIVKDLNFYIFLFGKKDWQISLFPELDSLPYDKISPHPEIIAKRLETLYKLITFNKNLIVVTSVKAILPLTLPKSVLNNEIQYIEVNKEIDRDTLLKKILDLGYNKCALVEELGDYSVRGGIIDIFPPLYNYPIRIDCFGNFVESIRLFNPETQRSLEEIKELTIIPVKEIILNSDTLDNAVLQVYDFLQSKKFSSHKCNELLEEINTKIFRESIESLLPLFYLEPASFFSYLPHNSVIIEDNPLENERVNLKFLEEINERFSKKISKEEIVYPPDKIYLTNFKEIVSKFKRISIENIERLIAKEKENEISIKFKTSSNDNLHNELIKNERGEELTNLIKKFCLEISDGWRIFIVSSSFAHAERIFKILSHYPIKVNLLNKLEGLFEDISSLRAYEDSFPIIYIYIGQLSEGMNYKEDKISFITEEELFGERLKGVKKLVKSPTVGSIISSFSDLNENDYVVHVKHGIGIYKGLKSLEISGVKNDYLLLEYADKDKLYIPADKFNLVQKYIGGDGVKPKIDKLGGTSWQTLKKKTKEAVKKIAKELLELYAARQVIKGYSFSPIDEYYEEFAKTFLYEETPDQKQAIEEVLSDMEKDKPMDRLICGDVGYGKTEVAIRASFKAVMDKKQVAVLVPTTVLALQHHQTFNERFKNYPILIESLSRLKSISKQREVLKKLKEGKIDIIIGTHRLLQKDVIFYDLGLLIIDEEQRFGVIHKEKIKSLKKSVDVLTMTATPIPRTLHLSLTGIRDLSVINTPPPDRLSIRTFIISPDDTEIIKEGIERELKRGGQVFFVHNSVQTILNKTEWLKSLVPNAKITYAHGQMDEDQLENIMLSFQKKEYDILVCTSIIESGLDFPQANTIIIDRADKFGLSQLYQIRGRVGRSKYKAYAYLIVPDGIITKDAEKRLNILQQYTDLGSGFKIAMQDLNIRGAGNILGSDQSGHILAVGFEMYTKLLEEAINELKGIDLEEEIEPEINLGIPAYIPEDYIKDTHQRLSFYKKLSMVKSDEEIPDILDELVDRYGNIPNTILNLIEIIKLKLILKKQKIISVEKRKNAFILTFHQNSPISGEKLVKLIEKEKNRYLLTPDMKLTILYKKEYSLTELKTFLKELN